MGIVPIVEGHGEVQAVPVLLRRLLERCEAHHVRVERHIRVPRGQLRHPDGLERAVRLACMVADDAAVLILLDADDDCPAELGPALLSVARSVARASVPVAVVVARAEYESWLLAGLEGLRGRRGVREDATAPVDPESVRGAKEYLQQQMEPGRYYSETVDQPALTQMFDLDRARQRSPSFDKLWREVERLAASHPA
ncbi:DUF4276 family protein [Geochorda subterranea]|uniref:DUF4276 family protein n=1 Tax=Geochorda subterranea TaxID=3109564 RepID=A0ABZ1BLI5_9FIRM|nr:DUF4276 family protein [Limnochorda sp. LNt]WRP13692.1 DUF4276 family protein [Limnochorda sp. LNt]